MTALHNPRTRRALALGAAAVALAATGCSGDDDPGGDATTTESNDDADRGDDDVDEPTAERDDLSDQLDEGGETVDDVEIVHDEGSETVRIGGLDVSATALADYVGATGDIVVPSTWPTLALRAEQHVDDPIEQPLITWAVFQQTGVVTDEGSRSQVLEQFWSLSEMIEVEPTHTSTTVGDGVTCVAEVRSGDGVRGPVENAIVLFSGSGLASSAVGITSVSGGDDLVTLVGEIVESACGQRPSGT